MRRRLPKPRGAQRDGRPLPRFGVTGRSGYRPLLSGGPLQQTREKMTVSRRQRPNRMCFAGNASERPQPAHPGMVGTGTTCCHGSSTTRDPALNHLRATSGRGRVLPCDGDGSVTRTRSPAASSRRPAGGGQPRSNVSERSAVPRSARRCREHGSPWWWTPPRRGLLPIDVQGWHLRPRLHRHKSLLGPPAWRVYVRRVEVRHTRAGEPGPLREPFHLDETLQARGRHPTCSHHRLNLGRLPRAACMDTSTVTRWSSLPASSRGSRDPACTCTLTRLDNRLPASA